MIPDADAPKVVVCVRCLSRLGSAHPITGGRCVVCATEGRGVEVELYFDAEGEARVRYTALLDASGPMYLGRLKP